MKLLFSVLLILCSVNLLGNPLIIPEIKEEPKVIYGEDDRKELYELDFDWLKVSRSVFALVSKGDVVENDKTYSLSSKLFSESYKLCLEEPYRDQPNPVFCSGFLVDKDIAVTAGHCIITDADCEDAYFMFDFDLKFSPIVNLDIHKTKVYSCKKIIARHVNNFGADYAVIKLDRKVWDREPLKLTTTKIAKGEKVSVIGHPMGLPKKYAEGTVRDFSFETHFDTNLDTYGGNSGSPVFYTKTKEVAGILVRGSADLQWDYTEKCYNSNVCPEDGCFGESVTKIKKVIPYIKELENDNNND